MAPRSAAAPAARVMPNAADESFAFLPLPVAGRVETGLPGVGFGAGGVGGLG